MESPTRASAPARAPADPEPAAALVQGIAAGSEQALREFYDAFQARVYAFALRRLSDPHDAADVLNDVMLEVWRCAGRFEGRSRVLTWLFGIAHHKVGDRLRQRGHRATEALDPGLADEREPGALQALAGAQDAERVRRCVERLSDAHRQVVHLAFYEDLAYEEIARIVGCPEGTVKTRMFHARRLLKRCLAGHEG